jgi:hypothetical protein
VAQDLLSPSALPAGDWLIDLTFPNRRHPREVTRRARAAIDSLCRWLDGGGNRRVLHTSTFVVGGYSRSAPIDLAQRLAWDDSYVLAKSAAEQSIRRRGHSRLHVLRLGNVITPNSMWGQLVLRAASVGAVQNSDQLDAPANLTEPAAITQAIEGTPPPLSAASDLAEVTWSEVVHAVRLEAHGGDLSSVRPREGDPPESPGGRRHPQVSAMAYRAGALLPLNADQLDIASDVIPATLPPRLPVQQPMAAAGRDPGAFRRVVDSLADAYVNQGYLF